MGVVAGGIAADSENTSEPKGEGGQVLRRCGNKGYCLRARDPMTKTTKRQERLERRWLRSIRGDSWVPMRKGIRRKNRSLIPRVRALPSEPIQIWGFLSYGTGYCDTGEEIKEPEVDLSNFLARQRLDDAAGPSILKLTDEPDEDEVDHSLAHLNLVGSQSAHKPMKGRVQMVEWDEELENMSREKAIADANRGERGESREPPWF